MTTDRPRCTVSWCDAPRAIERVTPGGQVRLSAWCSSHREAELLKLAERRQAKG